MTASELQFSILEKAFKGLLVSQNLEDEDASLLALKLDEERNKLKGTKKVKNDRKITTIFKNDSNSFFERFPDGTVVCIDEELPFEIPSNWTWQRLASLSIIQEGPGIRSFQYKDSGAQLLTVTNILEGAVDFNKSKKYISQEEYDTKYSHFQLEKGDIVCACSGGSWGKSAIYPDDNRNIILNTSTLRLRFFSDLAENKYLYYLTKSDCFKSQLKKQLSGMQPNFGYAHYSKILIPLPPLPEQRRIVERIETLLLKVSRYKMVSEKKEILNSEICNRLYESLLLYAVQGKLVTQKDSASSSEDYFQSIVYDRLRLCEIGRLKKKDSNIPYIYNIEDDWYERIGKKDIALTEDIPYDKPEGWFFTRLSSLCWLEDISKSSGEKLPYLEAKYQRGLIPPKYVDNGRIVEKGTKVILVDGENSGEIFVVRERGYLGSTFKILGISNCISEEWLHLLLENYRTLFKGRKTGAAIPHLNKDLFRNLIVGVPPRKEQDRIVAKFHSMVTALNKNK